MKPPQRSVQGIQDLTGHVSKMVVEILSTDLLNYTNIMYGYGHQNKAYFFSVLGIRILDKHVSVILTIF